MNTHTAALNKLTDVITSWIPKIAKTAEEHPYATAGGIAAGTVAGGAVAVAGRKVLARTAGREMAKGAAAVKEAAPEIAGQAPRAAAGWLGTVLGAPLAYFGMTTPAGEGEDERARQTRMGLQFLPQAAEAPQP